MTDTDTVQKLNTVFKKYTESVKKASLELSKLQTKPDIKVHDGHSILLGGYYTLKPGDTSYGSKHGNAYVRHADGSWTNYLPGQTPNSPLSQTFPAGGAAASFFEKKVSKGEFKQIDHLPGIEKAAISDIKTEFDKEDAGQSKLPPMGSNLTEKQWKAAPEGTLAEVSGAGVELIKKDGKWQRVDGLNDNVSWSPDVVLKAKAPKEKKIPDELEDWEKELLGVNEEVKKNKLSAQDPNDAPSWDEDFTNPGGEWPASTLASSFVGAAKGFWHPVSCERFAFKKGDHLLQHKLTPASFAVLGADGTKKFQINKNGKKFKWSSHIPKSNYKVVYTAEEDSWDQPASEKIPDGTQYIKGADFFHPVSCQVVHIHEGETLMQHNFTPNSYLLLNSDGSMKYKINVKGEIQKAGTNLKLSNYHSIMTGPAPKVAKHIAHDDPVFHLMSGDEVQQYLDEVLEPGDYFTAATGGKWTKQEDGSFSEVSGASTSTKALKSLMQTDPPEGTKSLHDVPLNKADLTQYLADMEDGASITSGSDFSAKKSGNFFDVHKGDSHWSNMFFSTLATVVKTMDKSNSLNIKHEDPPPKPKPKNNEQGFPVNGTTDEIVEALNALPKGAKIFVPKFDWEAQKLDNDWKINNIDVWPSGFLAGIISSWSDDVKTDLQVDSGAPKLNSQGVPAYDEKAFSKWAKALPLGTQVGITTILPGSSKPATATKTGTDEWTDDASSKSAPTSVLAKSIIANKNGKADEFEIKGPLVTPAGTKAKPAAKKFKIPANIAGKSSVEITDEDVFDLYIKKDVFKELNFGLTGENLDVHNSWYQPDFLYHVDGQNNKTRVQALARDELGEAISNAIATIEYAKKNAGLLTGTKTKATKLVKKLMELHKIHKAAQRLQNNELPEEHPIDYEFVWGNKSTWAFDMSYTMQAVDKVYDEVKFKTESTSLGWDPFDGTHEQYLDYLTSYTGEGSWAVYADQANVKNLALHFMKAPGYNLAPYQIDNLKKTAAKGQFAEQVSEVMKAKNGQPFKPAFITQDKEFPETPSFMTDDEWNNIKGLLSGEIKVDFPESNLSKKANLEERYGHFASIIPPEASKALGGYFSTIDGSNLRFRKTLSYLLTSGIWNEDAATYEDPKFGKVALTPGMRVMRSGDTILFIPKDFQGGFIPYINPDGELVGAHVSTSQLDAYETVYTAPYKVTLKDAQQDGRNFGASEWKTVETVEDTQAPFDSFTGTQFVGIKKALGPDSSIKVSELSDKAKTLISLYPSYADIIVYKEQKGHYRVDEAQPEAAGPKTEWEATLAKDDVPEFLKKNIGKEEDPEEIASILFDLYFDDLDPIYTWMTGHGWEESEEYDYIANEIRDLITSQQANTLAKHVDTPDVAKFGSLHKLPNQNLGGMRPKIYYANPDGEMYMAKPDNKDKFRVDTEYAVVEIGKLFGFNIPDADIREIDGDYSYVQYIAPAGKNFYGAKPDHLTDAQLIDVMAGHTLDWAISQHDTHGGQLLMQPSGKVLKIDLGQAYKFLGSDKLDVGYLPPGNPEPVWYDKFYIEVQKGKVDKARLDKVTKAVLSKARRISTTKDAPYQQSLELAFSRRKNFPKGYDRESYTALAMDRKHQTFGDFYIFYKLLYAQGGYDFNFTPEQFEQTTLAGSSAHLAPTLEFAEQLQFAKAHGKSLFFASPEIEDAHALLYVSQNSEGSKKTLHADMKIRTDGDAQIKAWVQAQGVKVEKTSQTPATMQAFSGFDSGSVSAAGSLVAFAKTVSVHQQDGKYNKDTVATAKEYQKALQHRLNVINQGLEANTFYLHSDFQTGHQQYAWTVWAKNLDKSFDAVNDAMQKSEKSPMVDGSVNYTPPSGIEVTKDIKAIETVEVNGVTYTKYNDFTITDPEKQISPEDYELFKGLTGAVTKNVVTKEESKQVVAAPKYSVTKTNFKTPKFKEVQEDGTLIELGTQPFNPLAYDITSSDNPDITLHYFPHQYAPHDNTNQGRLQISIKDWDGSHDSVDRAMGMVNEMGIDTAPADETSLELFYWRHLAGILRQRKLDAQAKKTKTAMDALEKKLEGMSAEQEIEGRKSIFAALWGQDVVDNAEWRPQIGNVALHMKPADADYDFDVTAGRPHWLRPDFKVSDAKEWANGILPCRSDGWGSGYLTSGAYASNEEKIRYLGKFGDNTHSNSPTQDRGHGSSQFGFLRQGQYLHDFGVYVEPWVLARTSNYAFDSDEYGNVETRNKKSPFDFKGSIGMGGYNSSNELMFKYGLSVWDDIAIIYADSMSDKNALVAKFKAVGLTFVRGIAIEERIVTSKDGAKKAMAKIWAQAEKDQANG